MEYFQQIPRLPAYETLSPIAKPEDFQVLCSAEGSEEGKDRVSPEPTIEFFDPVDELPQFFHTINVRIVEVNLEWPLAGVNEGHIEEWRSGVAQVDRVP